ncbi:MAG: hypothetical protein C4520_00150 [Candidatus Abyssobacteria bacterium SURF_5]|uniref:Uncharacterized protein n=1 Tax=Abyssobacteria bacterium (strain SURF_5) TaxID=2093360 RepID=A0A3A4PFH6_ABYX5|nr:MAG: hypothetical protein C4520_00150 [Candidatus Abyssubacteria bacterium SURF_5]
MADKVGLIRLYSVIDGKLIPIIYRKEDLKSMSRIEMDGYVCGIVVLCEEDMAVDIEGKDLNRIRKNSDGTYSLKYFGTLKPQDLELPDLDQAYYEKNGSVTAENSFLGGGYSLFPRVNGTALDQESEFNLNFSSAGKTYTIPIRQRELTTVQTVSVEPKERDDITFQYIGNDLDGLKQETDDFEQRLYAITEGIDYVESTLGVNLVDEVTIIDYEEIYNAVTCDEGSDIWFYVRTLREEPLDELRTIAAHETLHILGDRIQCTASPGFREYFADLKGFDDFSYERFMLTLTGNALSDETESNNNVFFSFINEKNFLENMKGGHSQKNMEELFASFFHSLIFMDRLQKNLDKPVKISGARRRLSAAERRIVLDEYLRGIRILLESVSQEGESNPIAQRTRLFLRDRMEDALALRNGEENLI